jgi:hypothetical protein
MSAAWLIGQLPDICEYRRLSRPCFRRETCSGNYIRSTFAQNLIRIPVDNRKLFCEPPPNCVNK